MNANSMGAHLSRRFLDEALIEWEAYVSAGQPGGSAAARIYFVCLNDVFERPRFVTHESGDTAEAHRVLAGYSDAELAALLEDATPLE